MPIGTRRARRPSPRYPDARRFLSRRSGLAGLGLTTLLASATPALADAPDAGPKKTGGKPVQIEPAHLGGEAPVPSDWRPPDPKPAPPAPAPKKTD